MIRTVDFYITVIRYEPSMGIIFVAGISETIKGLDVSNSYDITYKFSGGSTVISNIFVDGDYIFSCGDDGTVKQWSVFTKRLVYTFDDKGQAITAVVAFNDTLIYGTLSGSVYNFQINTAMFKNLLYSAQKLQI